MDAVPFSAEAEDLPERMLALGDKVQAACSEVPEVLGYIVLTATGAEYRSRVEPADFKRLIAVALEAL